MTTRGKRTREQEALPPSEDQIQKWLHGDIAKARYKAMKNSKFFEGAFVKFDAFSNYRLLQFARHFHFESLVEYNTNNVKIYPLLVKLFLANMNLDHMKPQNTTDCIWTMVCGKRILLPLQRLGQILKCAWQGLDIDDIEVNRTQRDEVSHKFISDDLIDMRKLTSTNLRPQARLLNRVLVRTINPRKGSYEKLYKRDFQALYAIYSQKQINWAKIIMDEWLDITYKRKYKTLHYGVYITRILTAAEIQIPDAIPTKTIKEIGYKTLKLMDIDPNPSTLDHLSFEEWTQHVATNPESLISESSHRQQTTNDEGIQIISPEVSSKQALVILSQNQSKLHRQFNTFETKTTKKFDSIKKFLNQIWNAVSCSGTTSTQAQESSPFQWSTSSQEVVEDSEGSASPDDHDSEESPNI